jgi:uncharacterized protein YjbI with pentapeptide repeats
MNGNLEKYDTQKYHVEPREGKKPSPKAYHWNEIKLEIGLISQRLLEKTGFQHKTLWDLLQLFGAVAVPIVLFLAGQSIQERSQLIAENNRNQEILSTYLEEMTDLLLDYHLRDSQQNSLPTQNGSEVNQVARAKTLNAVRRLSDGDSKGQIIKFLYESDLIGRCSLSVTQLEATNCQPAILHLNDARLNETIVLSQETLFPGIDLQRVELNNASLAGVDLSYAQLQHARLRTVDLSGAILQGANLQNADLANANLSGVRMSNAVLSSATLYGADLSNATMQNADLSDAHLNGANLNDADLQDADLRHTALDGASLQDTDLKGAQYNRTTTFPTSFNPLESGMILAE